MFSTNSACAVYSLIAGSAKGGVIMNSKLFPVAALVYVRGYAHGYVDSYYNGHHGKKGHKKSGKNHYSGRDKGRHH